MAAIQGHNGKWLKGQCVNGTGPKYSYEDAEGLMVFVIPNGITTLGNATPCQCGEFFGVLLSTLSFHKQANARKRLEGLDYTEMHDRWYALNELLGIGATLPGAKV